MTLARWIATALCVLRSSTSFAAALDAPASVDATAVTTTSRGEERFAIACDPLHPAHFTTVLERRPGGKRDTASRLLFAPERPTGKPEFGAECAGDPSPTRAQIGRWSVSERSELVITFDPVLVKPHVGYLGRIDVAGRVVTGGSTRKVEVPGYSEIGLPTPSAGELAIETEGLFADVAALLKARQGLACNKDLTNESWVLTQLFQNATENEALFRNILQHSAAFAVQTRSKPDDELAQVLLLARLGQRVIANRATVLRALADRIAEEQHRVDVEQWRIGWNAFRSAASSTDGNEAGTAGTVLARFSEAPYERAGAQSGDSCAAASWEKTQPLFCGDRLFAEYCTAWVEATRLMCNPAERGWLASAKKQRTQLTAVEAERLREVEGVFATVAQLSSRANDLFEARLVDQRERLRSLTPAELYHVLQRLRESHAKFAQRRQGDPALVTASYSPPAPFEHVARLDEVPYLAAFLDQLRDRSYLPDCGTSSKLYVDGVITKLRSRVSLVQSNGWREIRLQPRALGAREGDIIELEIAYVPSGTSAAPIADAATPRPPTNGETRPARWTVRFLVDRVGFYVDAGPRVGVVWTARYDPTAATFRGARGVLVPGIGVDFLNFTDLGYSREKFLSNMLLLGLNGFGFRVDYLDFDSKQAVELGLEAHLSLLRGIATLGVGYNLGSPSRGFTKRAMYYSLGIGVEKIFDAAIRLGESFSR